VCAHALLRRALTMHDAPPSHFLPSSVHLVAVATPPAFTGDAMPASDPEMDVAVAGGTRPSARVRACMPRVRIIAHL
jgi:hypothetical protein